MTISNLFGLGCEEYSLRALEPLLPGPEPSNLSSIIFFELNKSKFSLFESRKDQSISFVTTWVDSVSYTHLTLPTILLV